MDLRLILEKFRINAGISQSLYELLDISGCNTYSYKDELPKKISFSFNGEEKPYLYIEKIEGGYKVFFSISKEKYENVGISMKTYSYELAYNLLGELQNFMISFSYHPSMFSSNSITYFIDNFGIYNENWDLVLAKEIEDRRPYENIINDMLLRCEQASVQKRKHLSL